MPMSPREVNSLRLCSQGGRTFLFPFKRYYTYISFRVNITLTQQTKEDKAGIEDWLGPLVIHVAAYDSLLRLFMWVNVEA